MMNALSSRSHMVYTFTLNQFLFDKNKQKKVLKSSKLTIVDLAGSEKVR